MKTLFLTVLGVATMSATTAVAGNSDAPDPDEVICKYEKRTDSRFRSKICHTRAQWAAIAEQHKRNYSEMRDRPVIETRKDN